MIKKSYKLIIIMLILILPLKVKASSIEQQRMAVLETAKAFYWKDAFVQYDSYRQEAVATPEDASSNHTIYTDCGFFLYQVYNQALGVKIPADSYDLATYASKKKNNSVIFNMVAPYTGSTWDNTNILNELRNWLNSLPNLETGDILVYRRFDGTGHVMMIDASDKSNIKVIESAYTTNGGFYDATNHIDKVESKSIMISNLSTKITNMINYGNGNANSVYQVSILRFITNGTTYINDSGQELSYDLTKTAQSRIQYPGITITKTAEVSETNASVGIDSAVPGSTIIYRLVIKNNGNVNYSNISVKEEKSSNVSFKDRGNGTVSGNYISWNIPSIKVGETKTIIYSVKVGNDDNLLGDIVISKGYVANIKTATITHYLLNALSKENVATLKNTYNSLSNDNSYDMEFIAKVYNNAFGYDLSYINNLDLNNVLSMKSCGKNDYCWGKITDKNVLNITLLNYYGLRVVPFNYKNTSGENILSENLVNANNAWDKYENEANTRAREIKVNDLQVGDVVIYKDSTTKAYLYLGDNVLVRKGPTGIVTLAGNDAINFLRNIIGDNYMILRPAIMMNKTYAQYVETKKYTQAKKTTKSSGPIKRRINSTADGVEVVYESIENPDCGYTIPALFILSLGGLLILIKIKLKPNKLYRIH